MESNSFGGSTLADYTGVLRRRWWLVGIGFLAGLALAAAYILIAPRTYQATAKVLVTSTPGVMDSSAEGARLISGINLDTEAQLVKSQPVAATVQLTAGTAADELSVEGLIKRVSVTVPPSTTVLNITVTGTTPEQAQQLSSAFADAYLANRKKQAQDALDLQTEELQKQRDFLKIDIASLTSRLAAATTPQARAELSASLNDTASELRAISGEYAALKSRTISPGIVVAQPVLPAQPVSPNPTLALLSGALLGVVLGLFLAFMVDRRDPRIHDVRELRRRLRVPVLVQVPLVKGSAPEVIPAHTAAGQSFVQLRTVLLNALPDGAGVVVISGTTEGTGADAVAANLAATVARADHDTVLLVADARSTAPALLGVPQGPGLAEVLRKGVSVSAVSRESRAISGLKVIAPGVHLEDDVEDLEGAGIADVLAGLAKEAQVVIVLAPPTSRSADAQSLARLSDGALLVVEIDRSSSVDVKAAMHQLQLVGTPMPGSVVLPHLSAGPAPIEPAAPSARPHGSSQRR